VRPSLLTLAATLALLSVAVAAPPPTVRWEDAHLHVGEIVTVEGHVASARSSAEACVLEFDPGNPTAFRAVLMIPILSRLPQHPERLYEGRQVRVSGRVQRFQGRSEMVLRSSGQIEVVDEDAPLAAPSTPPPAAAPPTAKAPAPPAPSPSPAVAASPPPPPPTLPPAAPTPPLPPAAAPPTLPATAAAPVRPIAPPPPPEPLPRTEPSPEPPPAAAPPSETPPPAAPPPAALAAPVETAPAEPPPATKSQGLAPMVVAALACERARGTWRDAAASAGPAARTLTRCLDRGGYDCRGERLELESALATLAASEDALAAACR
jgi:hypothetical protein